MSKDKDNKSQDKDSKIQNNDGEFHSKRSSEKLTGTLPSFSKKFLEKLENDRKKNSEDQEETAAAAEENAPETVVENKSEDQTAAEEAAAVDSIDASEDGETPEAAKSVDSEAEEASDEVGEESAPAADAEPGEEITEAETVSEGGEAPAEESEEAASESEESVEKEETEAEEEETSEEEGIPAAEAETDGETTEAEAVSEGGEAPAEESEKAASESEESVEKEETEAEEEETSEEESESTEAETGEEMTEAETVSENGEAPAEESEEAAPEAEESVEEEAAETEREEGSEEAEEESKPAAEAETGEETTEAEAVSEGGETPAEESEEAASESEESVQKEETEAEAEEAPKEAEEEGKPAAEIKTSEAAAEAETGEETTEAETVSENGETPAGESEEAAPEAEESVEKEETEAEVVQSEETEEAPEEEQEHPEEAQEAEESESAEEQKTEELPDAEQIADALQRKSAEELAEAETEKAGETQQTEESAESTPSEEESKGTDIGAEEPTEILPNIDAEQEKEEASSEDKAKLGTKIDLNAVGEPEEKAPEEEPGEKVEKKAETPEAGKKKKLKKKSKVGKIILWIVIILAAVYAAGAVFYHTHFFNNAQIGGVDAGNKSVQEVSDLIEQNVGSYTLTLKERDDQKEIIKGTDISLQYAGEEKVQEAVNSQNPFLWPVAFFREIENSTTGIFTYDQNKLTSCIDSLNAVGGSGVVKTENAHPAYENGEIVIRGVVKGNELDRDVLDSTIQNAISIGEEEIDLEEAGCYKTPKYTADNDKVLKAKETMESYLDSEITYNFGDTTETINKDVFGPWLVTDDDLNVSIDETQMKAYLRQLGAKYDTAWGTHTFTTSTGQTISVTGGGYGWVLDEEQEAERLPDLIKSGKKQTVEPIYSQTAKTRKNVNDDIGDTYVEISISAQHMWMYKDGNLVVETDVVTGDPTDGNSTTKGVYSLQGKQRHAILKGEGYSTPVSYWMPFNGGIGIHDSSWRSSYGGTIYRGNGSHGCVNTPLSKVSIIYENIEVGDPVVVY